MNSSDTCQAKYYDLLGEDSGSRGTGNFPRYVSVSNPYQSFAGQDIVFFPTHRLPNYK